MSAIRIILDFSIFLFLLISSKMQKTRTAVIKTSPLENFPPMQKNKRTERPHNSPNENALKILNKTSIADKNQIAEKINVGEFT